MVRLSLASVPQKSEHPCAETWFGFHEHNSLVAFCDVKQGQPKSPRVYRPKDRRTLIPQKKIIVNIPELGSYFLTPCIHPPLLVSQGFSEVGDRPLLSVVLTLPFRAKTKTALTPDAA